MSGPDFGANPVPFRRDPSNDIESRLMPWPGGVRHVGVIVGGQALGHQDHSERDRMNKRAQRRRERGEQRCPGCNCILSIYNPGKVCGPCEVGASRDPLRQAQQV